jgi:sodium/proline symporter
MDKQTVIIITLICYKLVLLAIGFWAQGKNKDTTDLFLGGRKLGPLVASVSYAASSSSAWTILGVSGITYIIGVSAIWFVIGSIAGHLSSWYWLSRHVMNASKTHKHITVIDLIASGTSGVIRRTIVYASSLIIVVLFMLYVSAQFQGAGVTFSSTFDLGVTESIIIGGVVILIYTMLGGFWAVSITDTIQGLLIASSAILIPIVAFIAIGNPMEFIQALRAVSTPDQLTLTSTNVGLQAVGFIFGTLSVGLGVYGQPHLLTRFMAIRDEKALRQAQFFSVFWFILVFLGVYFIGLCGHILLPNLAQPESVFFALIDLLFHPVLAGILIAAVLSAVMSTADSQLLVTASVFAHDLGFGERKHGLLISRFIIALVAITAIVVALVFPESIFKRVLFAWSALSAAFAPTVILRAIGKPLKGTAVLLSILTGFFLTIYLHFETQTPGDVVERMLPITLSFAIVWFFGRKP